MAKQFGFNPSSWFNNIFFGKEGNDYVYTLTNPNLGDMISALRGGYSEANMMLLVQTLPEFFFVINAVASRVKNGVFRLVDKDGNKVEDNPLWNKIVREGPNWMFDFDSFIWHSVAHRLVTGNRYGFSYVPSTLKRKHSNIQALWLIPPHYTMIIMKAQRPSYLTTTKSEDYIDHYHYTGGDAMSDLTPDSVVHEVFMKMGDATDIVTGKGISPFKAGEKPLANLGAVYIARNTIYVKQGPLGAIVSGAKDAAGATALSPEDKKEAISDLQNRFGINGQQSPFAFTSQPLSYIKMGSSINELEPFKETEASCAALCAIIGIPSVLMPRGSDAKFMNLDIAERNFYENVIFAEGEAMCNFLTKMGMFGEIGCHVEVSFDHVTCLQDDALKFGQAFQANAEASMALYDDGIITLNEVRNQVGHDPVENGDDYVVQDANGESREGEDIELDDDPAETPAKRKKTGAVKLYNGKKTAKKKFNYFASPKK